MSTSPGHIALLSANQFDPLLRDGGSLDILARLRSLQTRGQRVSILSFVPSDISHKYLADGQVTSLLREGPLCRAMFHGLGYWEEKVPCLLSEFSAPSGPLTQAILRVLDSAQVDHIITADTGYWPLFAAWYRRIPGCHMFFALNNVVSFARAGTFRRFLHGRPVFANSRFLQQRIHELLGLEAELWYTAIDLQAVRAPQGTRGGHIGFCAGGTTKGDNIVLTLARQMPERTFLVVGTRFDRPGGPLPANVTYWGHISDMRAFYREIRLLLVPSRAEEAFGRVIVEAAANGIPVIANQVGGIPEALGEGGLLIPYDPRQPADMASLPTRYAEAIQRVLDDPRLYRHYSEQALARAQQFELDQQRQFDEIYDRFFDALGDTART